MPVTFPEPEEQKAQAPSPADLDRAPGAGKLAIGQRWRTVGGDLVEIFIHDPDARGGHYWKYRAIDTGLEIWVRSDGTAGGVPRAFNLSERADKTKNSGTPDAKGVPLAVGDVWEIRAGGSAEILRISKTSHPYELEAKVLRPGYMPKVLTYNAFGQHRHPTTSKYLKEYDLVRKL